MCSFKSRASLFVFILILFGMLAATAGDLGAKSRMIGAREPIKIQPSEPGSVDTPDTLYGGGSDPGSDTGDPDDCDLNGPLFLWLVDYLF